MVKLTDRAPVKVMVMGRDETARMPLTAAELEKQRPAPSQADREFGQPHHGHDEGIEGAAIGAGTVGDKMPPSIGLCADEYKRVRDIRLMIEKLAEAVKARESEIKEWIIANLSKSDDTGAAGKKYRAQIIMKDKPQIADWAQLTACIAETGRFDLLQKRLGEKAVEDIWESGFDIPGVAKIHVPDVSITKI